MKKEEYPVAAKKTRIPQTFTEAAAAFEESKILETKRSRKIAWIIASICIAITFVSICAFLVALLVRPEPEPTIIQVDKSTGATTVLRSIKDEKDKYDEVINKYWLASYVRAREGYDWYTISEQFEMVKLMSESDVAAEYSKAVQLPNAPLATLKDKAKIIVKITSISFVGEDQVAQVRYTTEKLNTGGENLDGAPVQKWISTIAFKFNAGWMTEQQRYVNPLGFKTVTYRADPEVIK